MANLSVKYEYQLWCYVANIGDREFPIHILGWRMQGMYGDMEKANEVGRGLVDDKMVVDYEIVRVELMVRK